MANRSKKSSFSPKALLDSLFFLSEKALKGAQNQIQDKSKLLGFSVYRSFLQGEYRRRRYKSLLGIYNRFCSDCSSFYKDINKLYSGFSLFEVIPCENYNLLDSEGALCLGAAIWILDRLREAGKLEELTQCLPYVGDASFDDCPFGSFFVSHPYYSSDIIRGMLLLLHSRYGLYSDDFIRKEQFVSVIPNTAMHRYNLSDDYRKVLALLPENAIRIACADFRETVWKTVLLFSRGLACWNSRLDSFEESVIREDDTHGYIFNPEFGIPALGFNALVDRRLPSDVNALTKKSFVDPASAVNNIFGSIGIDMSPKDPVSLRVNQFLCQGKYLSDQIMNYSWKFSSYLGKGHGFLVKEGLDAATAELFENYSFIDPYGFCFALFYLVDMDDDMPWLVSAGSAAASYVFKMFPWCESDCEVKDRTEGDLNHMDDASDQPEESISLGVDFHNRMINGINLAQILYRVTGVAVPYSYPVFDNDVRRHLGKDADDALIRQISDLAAVLYMNKDYYFTDSNTDIDYSEIEYKFVPREDFQVLSSEKDKISDELDKAAAEITRLKESLAAMERNVDAVVKEKQDLEKTFAKERRELLDLRELVFNQENEDVLDISDSEKEHPADYKFPYTTLRRTVVFGGHDTFLKAMRPMFPSVRFMDTRNVSFSPEVVRNADIVWIQNNCISHPQFWNVVRIAGQYDVPIRYFTCAGVDRCAKQLVDGDLNGE